MDHGSAQDAGPILLNSLDPSQLVVDLGLDSLDLVEFILDAGLGSAGEDEILAMTVEQWKRLTVGDLLQKRAATRAE